jgi:hypothetical protein
MTIAGLAGTAPTGEASQALSTRSDCKYMSRRRPDCSMHNTFSSQGCDFDLDPNRNPGWRAESEHLAR